MVKSLSGLALLALIAASLMALPGFAPKVEAGEASVVSEGDRIEVKAAAANCSMQVWPDFATSCLRKPGSDAKIVEARLVTARR
jgi:hypothetical protein